MKNRELFQICSAFVLGSLAINHSALAEPVPAPTGVADESSLVTVDESVFADASNPAVQSVSKSVSVTSRNGKTVKKTVTIRDGVKEVVVETTDQDGNTTTTRDGGHTEPDHQKITPREEGPWLGANARKLDSLMRKHLGLEENEGVEVESVVSGSPAATAGLQKDDVILSLADTQISSPDELSREIKRHEVGDTVKLAYERDGTRTEVDVTFTEQPVGNQEPNRPNQGNQEGSDRGGDGAFDSILNNPDVPEDFKEKLREMRGRMKQFQEEPGIRPN